ncbi:hypothetical protein KX729_27795 [Rhizobium sp. XQZ8]|uniref:hypothetical protein n=1 Tax=Rhizobium populisoli TaxID=2859785 RepID=UPI001CA49ED6|nr:hypothetical protein [Rhizobium populisoli]MBW6425238.1 hypothetical protein [Rhizobium populisoli]
MTFGTWRGFYAISVVEVEQLANASESEPADASRATLHGNRPIGTACRLTA